MAQFQIAWSTVLEYPRAATLEQWFIVGISVLVGLAGLLWIVGEMMPAKNRIR